MATWEEISKELNEFVLDEDVPVTKQQKKAARERRQAERADRLMRLSKMGPNVPGKEIRRRMDIRLKP